MPSHTVTRRVTGHTVRDTDTGIAELTVSTILTLAALLVVHDLTTLVFATLLSVRAILCGLAQSTARGCCHGIHGRAQSRLTALIVSASCVCPSHLAALGTGVELGGYLCSRASVFECVFECACSSDFIL